MSKHEFLGISATRWAALLVLVGALGLLSWFIRGSLELEWTVASLRGLVLQAGAWGPLLYIGIISFRFAVLVPSSILLVAAGICFGPMLGTIYATIGLALSALLKYAVASVAGRDFLLRQLPLDWQPGLGIGNRRFTSPGLAMICAYPFGPKHIFQIAAILSGISLGRFFLAVTAGAGFRAAAFAFLGDALITGRSVLLASLLLLVVGAIPLLVPAWRRWLLHR